MLLSFVYEKQGAWKSEREKKEIERKSKPGTLLSDYPVLPKAFQICTAHTNLFHWRFQLFKRHFVLMNALSRGIFCILTNDISGCLLKPLYTITRMRSNGIWQLGLQSLFIVSCLLLRLLYYLYFVVFVPWANHDLRILSAHASNRKFVW